MKAEKGVGTNSGNSFKFHEFGAPNTFEKTKQEGGGGMNRLAQGVRGQTIEEDGQAYFVIGDLKIKITEHFPDTGKQIQELVTELITHKTRENVIKIY